MKNISGLRTGWYYFHCVGLSIVYLGAGFIFAFAGNLLPSNRTTEFNTLLSFANPVIYSLGALGCGTLISRGRRFALMISDFACILVLPLIFIETNATDVIAYLFGSLLEGWWIVGVFVYGKDLTIIHQPAFMAIFTMIMNSLGLVIADSLQMFGGFINMDYDTKKRYVRISVFLGLVIPAAIQLLLFFTHMKKEPIRYEFERSGEECAYSTLAEFLSNPKSISKIVVGLRRISVYKKFIGIKYMTLLSKYYRHAFLASLGLFSFKAIGYLLSFFSRFSKEIKGDLLNEYILSHAIMKTILLVGVLFFINHIQRKSLLYLGYGLSMITNAVNFFAALAYYSYESIGTSLFYMISITISEYFSFAFLIYIPYVFTLELLPDKGVAFAIAFYAVVTSVISFSFSSFRNTSEMKFIYYGVMCLTSVGALFFVRYYIKYTKKSKEGGAEETYFESADEIINESESIDSGL